jgi:hypothetical protein
MTKDVFDRLTKEEKQRGRTMGASASAAGPQVGSVTEVTNETLFSSFFQQEGKN